jgi:hypothetical protein
MSIQRLMPKPTHQERRGDEIVRCTYGDSGVVADLDCTVSSQTSAQTRTTHLENASTSAPRRVKLVGMRRSYHVLGMRIVRRGVVEQVEIAVALG